MADNNETLEMLTGGEDQKQPQSNPTGDATPGAFSFSGRARRSTYWGTMICGGLGVGVLAAICVAIAGGAFEYGFEEGLSALGGGAVLLLVLGIPLMIWAWAVEVRRCHDLGWSGWLILVFWLVNFIPVVGWIASGIFHICLGFMDGQPFTNQYGPDPKGRNAYGGQRQSVPPQQGTPIPPRPRPVQKSLVEQLRELKKLLDEGILTQEEFDAQKAKILSGESSTIVEAEQEDNCGIQNNGIVSIVDNKPLLSLENLADSMVAIPDKGYSICKFATTLSLWNTVMGKDKPTRPDLPIWNVSWNDCDKFLDKLNSLPQIKASGRRYRLPTAEEWEYACRAGAMGDYCKLSDGTEITADTLGEVAWFKANSNGQLHPAGQKKPNAFGLFDMHGNIEEWTSTWKSYGKRHCGGSWWSSANECKVGVKNFHSPSYPDENLGFRLACDVVK